MSQKTLLGLSPLGMSIIAVLTALFWAHGAFAIPLQTWVHRIAAAPLILAQTETSHKTEPVLRKTIRDLQEGKPDFDSMEPVLAAAVKEQAQSTADIYRHLGALKTLKYIGTRDGADIYRAVYEGAAVTYTIRLSPSGKINALLLQPAFPWE
jgi:hypothetical protein